MKKGIQGRMERKWLTVWIILLFVTIYITPTTAQDGVTLSQRSSKGNWLYVGGNGPGNYSKIQDAIDNASEGDTVFVYSGLYHESIVINKSIVVSGEDRNTTYIVGDDTHTILNQSAVVAITDATVEFKGFSIQKTSYYTSGIGITNCSRSLIHQNYVSMFEHGIEVGISDSITVLNNTIQNCTFGIQLSMVKNIRIEGNVILGNKMGYGIEIFTSIRNTILRNTMTNNLYGCILYFSGFSIIKENNFMGNTEQQALFSNSFFSLWYRNYWDQPRWFPKVIFGRVGGYFLGVPYINIDWLPAQKPYNIPG